MEGNNMNSEYNKEHIFDSQLKELLDKIDIICRQEQIPYFFTCAIKNDEQDTKYHSEMLSTLKSDRILKNDIIAECLKLLRGYHTTLSANVSTSLKNAENIKLTMSDEDILDIFTCSLIYKLLSTRPGEQKAQKAG